MLWVYIVLKIAITINLDTVYLVYYKSLCLKSYKLFVQNILIVYLVCFHFSNSLK